MLVKLLLLNLSKIKKKKQNGVNEIRWECK